MQNSKSIQLFVTGIDTNIGKTIASAILVETLNADYWKPVQAGELNNSDSINLKKLTSNTKIHPETYALKHAESPHSAAEKENINIELQSFVLPKTNNHLIIEGAGGVMVPLSKKILIIDLIKYLNTPVVLVAKNYLGSINHTLLSIKALQNLNIPILGIIINGKKNNAIESIIHTFTKCPILFHIPIFNKNNNFEIQNFIKTNEIEKILMNVL